MPRNQIRVTTNLEHLADTIGSYLGMADGIVQKDYMRTLMHDAHAATVPEFVKAAAASAVRFNFTHMYEYGVAGITRGDKRFISPLSPTARLWQDTIVGGGRNQLISFVYRDAVNRVPPHTTEETGVAQEELDKLKVNQGKRYVFSHRAEVFEQGIDVNIHPKQANGTLFVPLKTEGVAAVSRHSRVRDEKRGYTWAKKVHINPGLTTDSVGQFSDFFFGWWSSEGGNLMTTYMEGKVTKDIAEIEATMVVAGRSGMKSPKATNITGAAQRARVRTRKQWTVKAHRDSGLAAEVIF